MQHTTYLFGSSEGGKRKGDVEVRLPSDIVLEVNGQVIQASGPDRGNQLIRPVAKVYMRDLYFDPNSGLASEYTAWPKGISLVSESQQKGIRRIVMNPHRRFGEPILESCGYTADALWEAYDIEQNVDAVAQDYGVENTDVELALSFRDHLLSNAT